MGLGLAASVFQNFMRAPPEDTFLPPRASFFDPDALARWRKYQVSSILELSPLIRAGWKRKALAQCTQSTLSTRSTLARTKPS